MPVPLAPLLRPRYKLLPVHLLMLCSTALVATSFTVGKVLAPALDPAVITFIRFLLATLFFLPFILVKHGLTRPSLSTLGRYAIISGALVGFFWLMFLSLRYTTALNTGVIYTLVPGISCFYSAILLHERLGRFRILALLVAMLGSVLVIFHGDPTKIASLNFNLGDLIFLTGCLLIALYAPLVKLLHRKEPMAVMTFWILFTGTCWLLLLTGHKLSSIAWQAVALNVWAGIIYLALFTTIITFFITQWATLRIGPTRVMAYSYVIPPLILLLEWLMGHGLPPGRTIVGVACILPAMYIFQQEAATNEEEKNG